MDRTILVTYNKHDLSSRTRGCGRSAATQVIVADAASDGGYALSPDHVVEEREPLATVVERTDVPPRSRLHRLRVRGAGWWPFPALGYSQRGTIITSDEDDGATDS